MRLLPAWFRGISFTIFNLFSLKNSECTFINPNLAQSVSWLKLLSGFQFLSLSYPSLQAHLPQPQCLCTAWAKVHSSAKNAFPPLPPSLAISISVCLFPKVTSLSNSPRLVKIPHKNLCLFLPGSFRNAMWYNPVLNVHLPFIFPSGAVPTCLCSRPCTQHRYLLMFSKQIAAMWLPQSLRSARAPSVALLPFPWIKAFWSSAECADIEVGTQGELWTCWPLISIDAKYLAFQMSEWLCC